MYDRDTSLGISRPSHLTTSSPAFLSTRHLLAHFIYSSQTNLLQQSQPNGTPKRREYLKGCEMLPKNSVDLVRLCI
jgi:hypothetical protein